LSLASATQSITPERVTAGRFCEILSQVIHPKSRSLQLADVHGPLQFAATRCRQVKTGFARDGESAPPVTSLAAAARNWSETACGTDDCA